MAHPHCWAVVMAALMLLVLLAGAPTTAPVPTPPPPCAGETLYNGICLPAQWPPVTTVQFQASERVGGWPGAP